MSKPFLVRGPHKNRRWFADPDFPDLNWFPIYKALHFHYFIWSIIVGNKCHHFHFTVEETGGQRGSRGTSPWEGVPRGRRAKKEGQERILKPNLLLQSEGRGLSSCPHVCLGVARGMRGWANSLCSLCLWILATFQRGAGSCVSNSVKSSMKPRCSTCWKSQNSALGFLRVQSGMTQETTVTLALVQLTRSSLATNYQQVAEWSLEFPPAETFQESLAPGPKPSPRAARHGPRQAPLQAGCLSCWETKSNVLSYYGWGTSRGDKRVHWKARQAWTISHKREGTPEGDSHRGAALPLGHLLTFEVVFSSRWTTC